MTKKKLELMSKKGLLKRSMPYIKKYKVHLRVKLKLYSFLFFMQIA